ncbi:MAG TPA: hypothetical protein PKB09_01435 [Candidatus Saccharibacteria bacterium]|nr:hypothetical protein [Candidatus Saccharibacteria bacterium]
MAYGEPNQQDGSFKGPGQGSPPSSFNLPLDLRNARKRNSLWIAQFRSDDPVAQAILGQEIQDLTYAHTGQTVTELKEAEDAYYTRMMQADLGSTAVHGGD